MSEIIGIDVGKTLEQVSEFVGMCVGYRWNGCRKTLEQLSEIIGMSVDFVILSTGRGYKHLLIDNYMVIFKIDEQNKTVHVVTVQYQERNI